MKVRAKMDLFGSHGWTRRGEELEFVELDGRLTRVRLPNGKVESWNTDSFEAVPAVPAAPEPVTDGAGSRMHCPKCDVNWALCPCAEPPLHPVHPFTGPQGVKLDTGKPPLDLIEPEFIEEVARVLEFGAKKYDVGNWRKGMALPKVLAGVLRHVYATLRGEHRDPETGLLHVAHAACGLMFAAHYIRTGQLNVPDDRWKREVQP